ncbi:MAG: riboflavin biosynthesis protein RibF [Lachnospiraceae bacterium]|nr:riboflavin biosynthesis protein RibF [Lachnospiraceae bacterium]
MKIIRDLGKLNSKEKTAIAIGKFDGLHLGHQKLLNILRLQKKHGLKSVVVTFDPPPEVFFGKGEAGQLLTAEEKEEKLEELGVDILFYFPMNEINAAIPAESFVKDILLGKLNMAFICAGTDLRFGAGGQKSRPGNSDLLLELAGQARSTGGQGFSAEIIEKIYYGEREISSSYVREAVISGNMQLVHDLLGWPYSFAGKVTGGYQLGRTLGFPTANLTISEAKILPKAGVYLSKVLTPAGEFKGISNIGIKPTIDGERRPGAETFIYDFSGDLYGQPLKVMLREFIRPEKKFSGIDELKKQVNEDIEAGRLWK